MALKKAAVLCNTLRDVTRNSGFFLFLGGIKMATITVTTTSADAGYNMTDDLTAAAGGGDAFANDGNTFFVVANGGGGAITFGATTANTAGKNAFAIADASVSVGAGKTYIFGPFEPGIFNNSSAQVAVTYSGVTTVTVGAFKISY